MNLSYPNERIRGLQDLVERVSKELPLPEGIGNAKTQYQRLQGNNEAKSKDDYSDLKKVVNTAEEIGIPGSKEARAEFDVLLQRTNVPGQRQAQANFSKTLPATSVSSTQNQAGHHNITDARLGDRNFMNRTHSPDRENNMKSVSMLEYNRLVESEKSYKAQVQELTTRLSSFASKQLTTNNPNIADLSDRNRPTKLGEKFEQLYDNEWSEAFEYLKGIPMEEDQILKTLVDISRKAYEFCQDFAQQELERLESHFIDMMTYIKWTCEDSYGEKRDLRVHRNSEDKSAFLGLNRLMVDARKACATASIPALAVMFKSHVYKEQLDKLSLEPRLEKYVDRCVEYSFLMVVQDPPMYLEYPEKGQKINTSLFKPFRQKGSVVQMCVWPCVCLHKDGPVVCKGYVLPQ
uniref:Mitochondria-eating protein C-terminal domain-containing protein n=1 Tax=Magallana gigas TaxID=29159 RepID=A0A8W8LDX3_MAGGI|nr:uncharacterized protein LOC105344861 isoform X1 [Crassostrea gigas]